MLDKLGTLDKNYARRRKKLGTETTRPCNFQTNYSSYKGFFLQKLHDLYNLSKYKILHLMDLIISRANLTIEKKINFNQVNHFKRIGEIKMQQMLIELSQGFMG